MDTLKDIVNLFGNKEFVLGVLLILAGFTLHSLQSSFRQFRVMKKMNIGLKTLEQLTQQMSAIINEQRRTNRILAELAGEEVYQADEPSHRGSANSSGYSGNGQAANYYSTKSSDEMDIQSQNKLYVGNIDYSATESELEAHFAHFGQVEFVNIPVNRYNGRARGFGFVTFVAKQDAERAMSLNGSEFKGRQIQVNFAKERDSASQ